MSNQQIEDNSQAVQEILETRRDRFEQKRDNRAEAYDRLATKHKKLSTERYNQASQIADMISFGQPVISGHHSEGRHRRDIEKIQNNMDKSVQHKKTAKYYENKLAAMESNEAISSDDPDAIPKLEARLAELQECQELMKAANKIVRKKNLTEDEKIAQLGEIGIKERWARTLLTPDYLQRLGFADFRLQNNNANIRRIKLRLEELKARLAAACAEGIEEVEYPDLDLKLVRNREIDRIQLVFPGKPTEEVRSLLKKRGFNFSRYEMAWQRQLNGNGEYAAKCAIEDLQKLKTPC